LPRQSGLDSNPELGAETAPFNCPVTCGGIQISCPDKADWIPTQNWELKRHRSTAQ
jgi:hypothetical protein